MMVMVMILGFNGGGSNGFGGDFHGCGSGDDGGKCDGGDSYSCGDGST